MRCASRREPGGLSSKSSGYRSNFRSLVSSETQVSTAFRTPFKSLTTVSNMMAVGLLTYYYFPPLIMWGYIASAKLGSFVEGGFTLVGTAGARIIFPMRASPSWSS